VTIDGTDFKIQEPIPFNKKWYSKKFNGPGVRYRVGICIQTGWIVWVNGPFPCGEWSDIKIALKDVVYMFEEGTDERAVADKGYQGHPICFDQPWRHLDNEDQKARKAIARARHECMNRHFKCWRILHETFRHPLCKHGIVFYAVANVEQFLLMLHPNRTWQVEYNDRINNDIFAFS
jgi:DDE superfamily endonuclease